MKLDNRSEIIEIINKELANNSSIEIVILYGSSASDSLNESSDIDICIASETGIKNETCLEFSLSLTLKCGREVSVINMDKMEGPILLEVLNKGIRIKMNNPDYLSRFIIKAYDFAEDILPFQQTGFKEHLKEFIYD